MEGFIIVFIIAYLAVKFIIAAFMKNAAYAKGYDDNAHAWAMSFWLGLAGWLYVASLPDLVARKNQETLIRLMSGRNMENSHSHNRQEESDLPEL